jgi:hypothetical protein
MGKGNDVSGLIFSLHHVIAIRNLGTSVKLLRSGLGWTSNHVPYSLIQYRLAIFVGVLSSGFVLNPDTCFF